MGAEQGQAPALLAHTGRYAEAYLVGAVVSHLVGGRSAALLLERLGDDVDGAAHTRRTHLRGAQSALRLQGARHIAYASPVAPVDRAVLHVVHGHAVHHRSHVRVVEAAHVDLRVAPSAALLVGVHARCRLQHLGELLCAQLLLDFLGRDRTQGNGRLAVQAQGSGHGDALQADVGGLQLQGTHIAALVNHEVRGLESHVGNGHLAMLPGITEGELTLRAGYCSSLFALQLYVGTHQRFAGLGVHQSAFHGCLSHSQDAESQHARQHQ